jgi:hypothetical protein
VPDSQVEANGARPAVENAGAAQRSRVIKETSLHAAATSFAHKAQVLEHARSTPHPPSSSSPLILLSRFILAALMRRALAESTTFTSATASEVEGDVAVVIGSILDDSVLLSGCCGSLQPPLKRQRRRNGGGSGTSAWRVDQGGSGGQCRPAGGGLGRFFLPICGC